MTIYFSIISIADLNRPHRMPRQKKMFSQNKCRASKCVNANEAIATEIVGESKPGISLSISDGFDTKRIKWIFEGVYSPAVSTPKPINVPKHFWFLFYEQNTRKASNKSKNPSAAQQIWWIHSKPTHQWISAWGNKKKLQIRSLSYIRNEWRRSDGIVRACICVSV